MVPGTDLEASYMPGEHSTAESNPTLNQHFSSILRHPHHAKCNVKKEQEICVQLMDPEGWAQVNGLCISQMDHPET